MTGSDEVATAAGGGAAPAPDPGLAGVVASSRVMALGTVFSRATGFVRTVVIATALGITGVGDAYNVANTVPNIIYELLLGGVLSSVIVPLLVEAAARGRDAGEEYARRLLTVVTAALALATAAGVVLAPWITGLYVGHADHALTTSFARFFLPQIFFYGVGALLGAILNVRGSFAPPMWAPILNNIVVIATGLLFILITHGTPRGGQLSTVQLWVLGLGTTLGIVAQTVALLPALRRVGFRLGISWGWREAGLSRAARLGGWVLLYVAVNQIGFVVIVRLAKAISPGAFSAYTYAFFLVSLPHAIVAVSVITALLPRMSANALRGRRDLVADDLGSGLRLSGVILVPAELACIAVGPLIGTVVFDYLHISTSGARLVGAVLAGYAVSLVPFSAFQLQLRAFYALRDTRTPALVNIVVNVANIAVDLLLFFTLHGSARTVGLAIGYSVSYIVGALVFTVLLRRRLGPAAGARSVPRTYARLSVAGCLAAGLLYLVSAAVVHALGRGPLGAGAGLAAGCAVAGPAYLRLARRLRVSEVREVFGRTAR